MKECDVIGDVYFSCDWVIQRPSKLEPVFAIAQEMGCVVRVSYHTKQLDNQCHVSPVIVRAPSAQVFEHFIVKVKPLGQFFDCKPANEESFNELGLGVIAMGSPPLSMQLEELGQLNEAIMDGNAMWCSCQWVVQPLAVPRIHNILKVIEIWSCPLHFHRLKPEPFTLANHYYYLLLFLHINPTLVHEFIQQLSKYIDLQFHHWLFEQSSNVPVLTLELLNFDQSVRLTKASVVRFWMISTRYGWANKWRRWGFNL